jgi:hypothetical protein
VPRLFITVCVGFTVVLPIPYIASCYLPLRVYHSPLAWCCRCFARTFADWLTRLGLDARRTLLLRLLQSGRIGSHDRFGLRIFFDLLPDTVYRLLFYSITILLFPSRHPFYI